MAFADSRGPGNPTGSAQCAGPGNGSSRHTVVPLCGYIGILLITKRKTDGYMLKYDDFDKIN